MPRALAVCPSPGCPELVASGSGKCPNCRRAYDTGRGHSAARGYSGSWARIRRQQLRREPACAMCGGPAEHVDHIHGGGPKGPNPDELQSLCASCHSRKTVERERGFGREPKDAA